MLSFLSLFLSPAVQIGLKIADLIAARQQAKTDVELALIDEQIKQLSYQRDVLVKAMDSSFTRTVYWCLLAIAAIGPIAYIEKVFLWDKTIGAFLGCSGRTGDADPACHIYNTDALADPNLWWITVSVFGFLFLTSRRR